MVGTHTPGSQLEIYGREFEARPGYGRLAPLVNMAALSRDEEVVEWKARIDTGACISTFPDQLLEVLPAMVLGPPVKISGFDGLERTRTWRLPMVISGERGSSHDRGNDHTVCRSHAET